MQHSRLVKVLILVLTAGVGSVLGVQGSFTSIHSMTKLVFTEEKLIQVLQEVIKEESERLAQLTRYVSYMKTAHHQAMEDPEKFVLNPLNAFHLIKRLTIMSQDVQNLLLRPARNLTNLDLPVMSDLGGACEGLCRLQYTYQLNASELARGIINKQKYSEPMSANDAWEIGYQMYELSDYYHANLWFKVALDLDEEEVHPLRRLNRTQVLDYQALTVYMLGNVRKAVHLTEEFLKLHPNCSRNRENLAIYREKLLSQEYEEVGEEVEQDRPPTSFWNKEVQLKYEKLCRGEIEVNHRLVCRYIDNGNPYFKVGKVKMEEVSLEPEIKIFYDVIHDGEIEHIKTLATPLIKRSVVTNFSAYEHGQWEDRSRVSQTAFISPRHSSPVIAKVDLRSGLLAGLTHETAEDLQVLNYGIGGHYEPHYDYSDSPAPDRGFPHFEGNRIATLLYYMSDVEQGGATAFPDAGTAVFPRKGSAVLWYNLFRDGHPDPRTRHGACPVLIGSKWACNKWFHEGKQEFLRPCPTEPDSIVYYKHHPQEGQYTMGTALDDGAGDTCHSSEPVLGNVVDGYDPHGAGDQNHVDADFTIDFQFGEEDASPPVCMAALDDGRGHDTDDSFDNDNDNDAFTL